MAKKKETAQTTVRRIRRKTRKKYSAEDKIRIVIEGLRGETTVAELCRKEGISQSLYYSWLLLQATEGISRSWQAASCWQHQTPGRQRRCQGHAAGE